MSSMWDYLNDYYMPKFHDKEAGYLWLKFIIKMAIYVQSKW